MSGIRREIAGIAVAELARDFGTPTYIYDAAQIVQRIEDLSAFDVVRFAQKANSNLAVLDLCRRHGALVDAVSAGEIQRALRAGYPATGEPPPIVYTADIFDRDSLELVTAHGIAVNCGSLDMIEQYGARRPGAAITLRINPGFGHGHSRKTNTGGEHSKHGIWHEALPDALALADAQGLSVTGLHVHIGSGGDLAHLARVAGAVEKLALCCGPGLRSISAGGGLPVPYRPQDERLDPAAYFAPWDAARRRLEAEFGHALCLEVEPGRYLAAEAGVLLSEVRAVKRTGAHTFVLVDAGFNTLARPVMYGSYHPMSLCPQDQGPRPLQEVVVGGPLCESGDIFTQEEGGLVRTRRLPEARVGDLLLVECAGAYGAVMSSNYNSKPQPAEVLVAGGRAQLVRARQSDEDMLRLERLAVLDN